MINCSALVLTLNEEKNIKRCLQSLAWCDDIVVLDSFSTDETQHIAREFGVRIYQRRFDNYASQRNFGLHQVKYKNDWVLMLDADEIVSEELKEEIEKILRNTKSDNSMYRMRRKDHLFNKWIKHSSGYPTWFGRMVRPDMVTVKRAINEEYHTDGKVEYLTGHLLHYPFNKGISHWIDKHNKYSSMEAELLVNETISNIYIKDIWNFDPVVRRKALKKIIYSLPGRPVLIFFALYILRMGILDGKPGFIYCLLRAYYEFIINVKAKEIKRRNNGLSV